MRQAVIRLAVLLSTLLVIVQPARAVDDQQIKTAIRSAVAFLKSTTWQSQSDPPIFTSIGGHEEGPSALAGIALIEAGVDPGDPAIQRIAKAVRFQAVKQLRTYQLALDIVFLDKLGEDIDTTLIQSMGVRLLRGQSSVGQWTYYCPNHDDAETKRLTTALNGATSMKGKSSSEMVGLEPSKRTRLDPSLDALLKKSAPEDANPGGRPNGMIDDLSNTQFAVLGLWAARRHGVPVDHALVVLEKRLRLSQNNNGGWHYTAAAPGFWMGSGPMTCAGLLGLAITSGNKGERSMKAATINPDGTLKVGTAGDTRKIPNPLSDPAVKKGVEYLGQLMNTAGARPGGPAVGAGRPAGMPPGAGPPTMPPGIGNRPPGAAFGPGAGGHDAIATGNAMRDDLYFMWSLERICMVFGIATIGGKDWYAWGADGVIAAQSSDGSWNKGKYGGHVDTSLALMFLCRSNIVKDLSNLFNRKMSANKTDGGLTASTAVKPPPANIPMPKGPPDAAATASDPAAMAKELATATGARYAELLKQYTDSKGTSFTLALAAAIPQLTGETQKSARDALAERMARFSAATLKERLTDPDVELRRASALAVYMRDERELVPDLINALNDANDLVVRAARLALKGISEKDFGPAPGATGNEKGKAIADWKAWWEKQKK